MRLLPAIGLVATGNAHMTAERSPIPVDEASGLEAWSERQYGLRFLSRPAAAALIRGCLMSSWAVLLVVVVTTWRPDLLRPSEFGSDTSNYAAAGERLASGRDLYQLSAGDRPVPADNPPEWSVPILSPPTTATPWVVLSGVPDPLRFGLPWAAGLMATAFFGFALAGRAPLVFLVSLPILLGLVITAWSGNVNALVPAGAIGAWIAGSRHVRRTLSVVIGILVGALAAMKLSPILLVVWLVARRRWWATLGAGATIAAFGLVPLLADAGAFARYLAIAQATSSGDPSGLSLAGLAVLLGVDSGIARLLPPAALAGTALLTLVLRNRSALAFAASCTGLVFGLPIVRFETLGLILLAAVPLVFPSNGATRRPSRPRTSVLAALAALVAALALVNATRLGSWDRSTLVIASEAATPVEVRFRASGQPATFGYRVMPGETGVAWLDRTGQANGAVFVFDPACRYLGFVQLDAAETRVTIGMDGSAIQHDISGDTAPTAVNLPYGAECAAESRGR